MKTHVQIALFKLLRLLEPPRMAPEQARDEEFEQLYQSAVRHGTGDWLDYRSPYPKHAFLSYLVQRHPVLLHGSGNTGIAVLEPRRQTLFSGQMVEAAFASTDGIWSIFFACMPRPQGVSWSTRNAALATYPAGNKRTFYFFSLSDSVAGQFPWQDGAVYILPREPFTLQSPLWQEWTSPQPVRPLAKLAVSPADFPFLAQVGTHKAGDSSLGYWWRRLVGGPGINGR